MSYDLKSTVYCLFDVENVECECIELFWLSHKYELDGENNDRVF